MCTGVQMSTDECTDECTDWCTDEWMLGNRTRAQPNSLQLISLCVPEQLM